jgi:polyhydroxyalkanoate synthase subunit PhaC
MPSQAEPSPALIDGLCRLHFAFSDSFRRAQANALDALGLGPHECDFRVICSDSHWRLREYAGQKATPSLLIVAAPIKRPYIWDLSPSVSAVRYCLGNGLRVYLVEWVPPSGGDGHAGLDEYAAKAVAACVAAVASQSHGTPPFLIGHSLGGTLAAIFCALEPQAARGLVLLSAPLCFDQASSHFRDSLVSILPATFSETDVIAGSLLSQASAIASPNTFIWSRWVDAVLSTGDALAFDTHGRVERWALDEVALPGKLVSQIVQWLYREDRLCRGTLQVGNKTVGPSSLRVPTLAIINTADEVTPATSVAPFIERITARDIRLIEYPGEVGVALQHLALLAGHQAYARIWPEIISWIKSRS